MALFAQDLPGNVQPQVRVVAVSTEDNLPPAWLAAAAAPGPYDVRLSGATDEAALMWWFLLAGDVACPTTAQVRVCGRPRPGACSPGVQCPVVAVIGGVP